ncbi:MAG: hypothetical protein R3E32_13985 [Chitinophagales bacterium]
MNLYRPTASYRDIFDHRFTEASMKDLALLSKGEDGWREFMQKKVTLKIKATDRGAWCTNYFGGIPDWLFYHHRMLPEKEYPLQLNRMVVVSEKVKIVLEQYWLPPAHIFIPVEAEVTIVRDAVRASEANKAEEVIRKRYYVLYMPILEQFEDIYFPSLIITFNYEYDIYDRRELRVCHGGEISSYEELVEEYERLKAKHTFVKVKVYGDIVYKKPYDLVFIDRLMVRKELREALYESKLKGVVFQREDNQQMRFHLEE